MPKRRMTGKLKDVNVLAALSEVKSVAQDLDDLVPDDVPLEAVGVDEDEDPLPAEVPEELPAEVLEPVAEDVAAEPISEEPAE